MGKEKQGINDIWLKMSEFLGRLNGKNIGRESCVRTPEYENALEAWKEKEQEWDDFASVQELRAYTQGYVDCMQALYQMRFLKENE